MRKARIHYSAAEDCIVLEEVLGPQGIFQKDGTKRMVRWEQIATRLAQTGIHVDTNGLRKHVAKLGQKFGKNTVDTALLRSEDEIKRVQLACAYVEASNADKHIVATIIPMERGMDQVRTSPVKIYNTNLQQNLSTGKPLIKTSYESNRYHDDLSNETLSGISPKAGHQQITPPMRNVAYTSIHHPVRQQNRGQGYSPSQQKRQRINFDEQLLNRLMSIQEKQLDHHREQMRLHAEVMRAQTAAIESIAGAIKKSKTI